MEDQSIFPGRSVDEYAFMQKSMKAYSHEKEVIMTEQSGSVKTGQAREVVHTEKAPAAIGPYSQAIRAGALIYTSGQLGIDPATKKLAEGGVEEQARQAMLNLGEVLKAAGSDLSHIVKTTIFVTDLKEFPVINKTYGEFFTSDPPARSTVEVKGLPLGGLVEIEAVALAI